LTEIEAADAYCSYLAGRHYENFSVASRFLPSSIRRHLTRLYAYCRTTDDFGDESGGAGMARLTSWREQVEAALGREEMPIHPVLLALRPTVRECRLPAQPFLDLIQANIQDQTIARYESWDDLRAYCMLSAAPVGRLVLRIWGVATPEADRLSDDVCIGLQLANFAQDVAVDRDRGRTYLLQREVRANGVPGAVSAMCDRAEQLLASGRELEGMVPLGFRVQLALYRLGGSAILSAIRALDCRTDMRRPQVSGGAKLRLIPRALMDVPRGRMVERARRAPHPEGTRGGHP
jgi:squalene synthase HpnC